VAGGMALRANCEHCKRRAQYFFLTAKGNQPHALQHQYHRGAKQTFLATQCTASHSVPSQIRATMSWGKSHFCGPSRLDSGTCWGAKFSWSHGGASGRSHGEWTVFSASTLPVRTLPGRVIRIVSFSTNSFLKSTGAWDEVGEPSLSNVENSFTLVGVAATVGSSASSGFSFPLIFWYQLFSSSFEFLPSAVLCDGDRTCSGPMGHHLGAFG